MSLSSSRWLSDEYKEIPNKLDQKDFYTSNNDATQSLKKIYKIKNIKIMLSVFNHSTDLGSPYHDHLEILTKQPRSPSVRINEVRIGEGCYLT